MRRTEARHANGTRRNIASDVFCHDFSDRKEEGVYILDKRIKSSTINGRSGNCLSLNCIIISDQKRAVLPNLHILDVFARSLQLPYVLTTSVVGLRTPISVLVCDKPLIIRSYGHTFH